MIPFSSPPDFVKVVAVLLTSICLNHTVSAQTPKPRFDAVDPSEIRIEPFALVGKIESDLGGVSKGATGSVARSGVVFTAAEVAWSEQDGFSTRVTFQRGRLRGKVLETSRATYIVLLSGFTTGGSNTRVATNVAGLFFKRPPAADRELDLRATRGRLSADANNIVLGYASSKVDDENLMVGFSELTFTRLPSSNLHRAKNLASFPNLMKGGPVFHELFHGSDGPHYLLVGVVVSPNIVRGFSTREIALFEN